MTERYYRFAGLEFTISMPEKLMYEKEYRLAPFRVESVSDPRVFTFETVEALTPPAGDCVWSQPDFRAYENGDQRIRYIGQTEKSWEGANIRAAHEGKRHTVQVKKDTLSDRIAVKTVLNSLMLEHLVLQKQGLIFHCSFIDHKGGAVLFTAPSETGKSTQAELWNRFRGTQIINGDRAVIRVTADGILAEGFPFAGSSSHCENRSLPLKAIVYLAQAPRTTIRKMRGYEAFSRIWEGITVNTWDRQDMALASDLVRQIAEEIPVYYMPCTPDEAAVTALEEELEKLVNL